MKLRCNNVVLVLEIVVGNLTEIRIQTASTYFNGSHPIYGNENNGETTTTGGHVFSSLLANRVFVQNKRNLY